MVRWLLYGKKPVNWTHAKAYSIEVINIFWIQELIKIRVVVSANEVTVMKKWTKMIKSITSVRISALEIM